MKKCVKCGIEKEFFEYYKHPKTPDKLFPYCKECKAKYQKEYILKNPDYWKKRIEYSKAYSKTKKAKEIKKNYQQKEKYKESRKTLGRSFYDYTRGAKKRGKTFELTKEQFSLFWKKSCTYCGVDIETIGLDRVDNLVGYRIDNVVSCCGFCNRAKGVATKEKFIEWIEKVKNPLLNIKKETVDELSPRQIEFLKNYSDPKSETFGNALQSGLKAGYSQEYSESITAKGLDWLAENVGRRMRMLSKAEMRLETLIDSEDERVSADVSKFIAKTQGKNEGYSDRTEITGKDGQAILIMPSELIQKNELPSETKSDSE